MRPGLLITPSLRLSRPLGGGGMGSIWLADHLTLKTEVVVKFMSAALGADTESRARFSREAVAASQVKSPHVVQTFDHGLTDDGIPFIVMERLEGEDLAQRIRRARLTLREIASILTQVSRALTRAHRIGIVHRDIKPANIFLCDVGGDEPFVKLLDFGIAKATFDLGLGDTRTGETMGTPFYMSPEQFTAAKDIDFRTDLWSLGVVAFECLTGARPFQADSIGGMATVLMSRSTPSPSSLRPGLPAALDAWFAHAVARDPARRFQSASDLAEAFAGIASSAGSTAFEASETIPFKAPAAPEAGPGDLPFLTTVSASAVESLAPRIAKTDGAGDGRPSRGRAIGVIAVAGVGMALAAALGWTRMHRTSSVEPHAVALPETPSALEAPSWSAAVVLAAPSSTAALVASPSSTATPLAPLSVLVAPHDAVAPPDAGPMHAGVHAQPTLPRVHPPPKPSSADPFEPHVF
jgi:serine/threonine protein kinase